MTARAQIGLRLGPAGGAEAQRTLAEEVAVAISFDGTTLAVMMATPDDIADFAHGFALTEGVIDRLDQVESFEVVEHTNGIEARFWLAEDRAEALAARRRRLAGPVGCGLCGIDSLDAALRALPPVGQKTARFSAAEITTATEALAAHQPLHDQTRAVHAAGLLLPGQGIVLAREDVGRHNALDKLVGALARSGRDASGGAIVLTSRLSTEMVQKSAMARAPVVVSASAPTAQALALATDAGQTIAAFARDGAVELFSHTHRITPGGPDVA